MGSALGSLVRQFSFDLYPTWPGACSQAFYVACESSGELVPVLSDDFFVSNHDRVVLDLRIEME